MGIEVHLPTLGVVLGSAAIDSINPCAIGVLILMISVVLSGQGTTRRMLLLGAFYIFAIYLTYLSAGLGLVYFLASIPLFVTESLSIIVGSFIILAGLIEIKDFFWYVRGFVLPLLIILILVAFGMKVKRVQQWKQESRGYMRLFIGLLLIGLGWLLILIANGTVNFG